jgi:RND family efflux transporter MFP subunit
MLLGGAALIWSGCGQSSANADQSEQTNQSPSTVKVRVEELRPVQFADNITAAGVVKAREDVMLSPEEGGVIKEWLVEKGQVVRKGQIIGILNDDVLKASYEAAAAQYKLAELNFDKQKSVYAERAISELQFKNAQYTRDAAKAQADLMFARLERTRLRSPINGILDDRLKNQGEYAPPMVPVARIVNLESVKILVEISERFAGSVEPGNVVHVVADAFPADTLVGTVEYVGAAVSASNRTLPVEIAVPNPGQRLKPEMIVRARIVRSMRSDVLLVGENIIQRVDRERLIVYVEKDGKAEERVVRVGARRGNMLEVRDGLQPGDRVITAGFQKLVNGQHVTVDG